MGKLAEVTLTQTAATNATLTHARTHAPAQAKGDLKRALVLDPENRGVRKELKKVLDQLKEQKVLVCV
jgi:Tfp pilus assembly protein PilF